MNKIKKVVLICSSCGKETETGNASQNLQRKLEKAMKEAGKDNLVLLTSCLDICPKNGITVGYSSSSGGVVLEVVSNSLQEEMIFNKM